MMLIGGVCLISSLGVDQAESRRISWTTGDFGHFSNLKASLPQRVVDQHQLRPGEPGRRQEVAECVVTIRTRLDVATRVATFPRRVAIPVFFGV